jgi:adenylate kinase family enzyme
MERIAIVGCSGSGKSTLTRELAARTSLPAIHLDMLYWQPGWRHHPDPPAFHANVRDICLGPRWIVDGGFITGNADIRFARADTVVLFDLPTVLCLYRALKRYWRYRGETRPDLAPGCPEKFDIEFYSYILNYRRLQLPKIEASIAAYCKGRIVRLRSDRETAAFLASV